MARVCCLSVADPKHIGLLRAVLRSAGEPAPASVARLEVAALRKCLPDVLILDIDGLEVDPLELLRQVRFVLPDCLLVVYTYTTVTDWARACHLAGANCVLSKASPESQLALGLRSAIRSGAFTDPHFAA